MSGEENTVREFAPGGKHEGTQLSGEKQQDEEMLRDVGKQTDEGTWMGVEKLKGVEIFDSVSC